MSSKQGFESDSERQEEVVLEEAPQGHRKGGRLWMVFALLFLTGGAVLGWFLFEAQEQLNRTRQRLAQVSQGLSSVTYELDDAKRAASRLHRSLGMTQSKNTDLSSTIGKLQRELEQAMSAMADMEASLGLRRATGADLANQVDRMVRSLEVCRDSYEETQTVARRWQSEAERLADELNDCVQIANQRQQKINAAISKANRGIRWITDIPSEGSFFSSFGDPYEALRRKYNNLVDRFNAAVSRGNDLAELLADSLRELD
jgi:chromosome segregation ATPase